MAFAAVVGFALAAVAAGDCSNPQWVQAYCPERCHVDGRAAIVECLAQDGAKCGTRLEATSKGGFGSHSMTIKAAPGAGVVTAFYLSTNGGLYDKTCTHPWVELDFEIMGNQAGEESKIWTNLLRGKCEENWKWITVPFDVSADYHTYAFRVTSAGIDWTVDDVVYRSISFEDFEDAGAAAKAGSFQEFASVWGKSSSEAGEGIPEFREGLGTLDMNTHAFPLTAGFVRPAPAMRR